ncbi:hypothetical protein GUJ93_ZPchr0007g4218 [Zizania palustris]|uniref:Uncharacterized protein n=1 Tax=Zizania palustris TaxID=103762 RepID=A0A8J5TFQ6_ZIZPA|nr:hypothetical protein GUJ93_ZPchr0007g4218 [Zizania palustris]
MPEKHRLCCYLLLSNDDDVVLPGYIGKDTSANAAGRPQLLEDGSNNTSSTAAAAAATAVSGSAGGSGSGRETVRRTPVTQGSSSASAAKT